LVMNGARTDGRWAVADAILVGTRPREREASGKWQQSGRVRAFLRRAPRFVISRPRGGAALAHRGDSVGANKIAK